MAEPKKEAGAKTKVKTKTIKVAKLGQGMQTVTLGENEGLTQLLARPEVGVSDRTKVRVNNIDATKVGDELKEGDLVTTVPNVKGGA